MLFYRLCLHPIRLLSRVKPTVTKSQEYNLMPDLLHHQSLSNKISEHILTVHVLPIEACVLSKIDPVVKQIAGWEEEVVAARSPHSHGTCC